MMKPNPDTESDDVAERRCDPANRRTASAGRRRRRRGVRREPDPVAVLEAEKTDLKDKLLRTLADMENLRRRTEREVADARAYAVTNFARDMLNVADNVRRALESVPAEARATARGRLQGADRGHRADRARPPQDPGAPRGQEARARRARNSIRTCIRRCSRCRTPDVPNGTVVQVVQSGYVIGERVLRPALVGVAKGGPKAAPNGAAAEADSSSTS